jgi:uncharacterized protein YeaO (DUF488 family)
MTIRIKRVYEPLAASDGYRILVDRIWPRGLSKDAARIDDWLKDLGPSTSLRKWFNHDAKKWKEFKKRYFQELESNRGSVEHIAKKARTNTITFVCAAHDVNHSNAVALKQYLERCCPDM